MTVSLSPAPPTRPTRHTGGGRRGRSLLLGVVTVLSLGVVGYAVAVYYGFDPSRSQVGLREDVPWHHAVLMGHILTASVALALGPPQLSRRLRARAALHRRVGRAYLFAGVFPSVLFGVPAALLSTGGAWAAGGLLVGDVAWGVTGVVAYRAARRRRYRDHGRWMTWNFALTFAAVTFRIWLPLLVLVQVPLLDGVYGGDFDALFAVAYAVTCWLAFLPNVAVVVLAERRRTGSRTAREAVTITP